MIKAVIFDMDGLLIDSEPLWHLAEIEIFAQVNIQLTTQDCLKTTGLRIDEVVAYWYQRFPWSSVSQEQVAEQIVNRMIELIHEKGVAKQGVHSLLQFFQSQELPLALASSSAYRLIDAVVDHLGIREVFQLLCSATEEDYGKPHPAVYLTTASHLQIPPHACLALEDSLNGVLAAKAARMTCIAVPEMYPDHDPRFIIADHIVPSLEVVPREVWPGLKFQLSR
jgi:sugar-phosphatase